MASRRPNSSSSNTGDYISDTRKNEVYNEIDSIPPRAVENFILIWLDSNIKGRSKEYQNSIRLLQRFVNTILLVSDEDQYANLIENIKDEKIFIIVSGTFGSYMAPEMETTSRIHSVYVYCKEREDHEEWAVHFSKIKGVFTDIAPICDALRRDVRQATSDLIRISILSSTNSDEYDQLFICSLILKDVLINSEINKSIEGEFIEFCRLHYAKNSYESDIINDYRNNNPELSPIQWYTRECFIYSMLNRALKIYDIEILTKIIFFVQQLHQQIEGIHSKSNEQQQLTVYHGQKISNDQFTNLEKSINSLISFNTFLSTTIDEQVSLDFARPSENDSNLIGVLFKIIVDPSTSSCPFIILDKLDYYKDSDQHVLFSLNAVFRIRKCEQLENRLWQVDLNLIDNNDEKMKNLTESIEEKFGALDGFLRLGKMMVDMGERDRAEKIFQMLRKTTKETDMENFAYIHRKLGQINYDKNDFDTALVYYNQCLEIRSWYRRPDEPSSHSIYTEIGTIQKEQGNLDEALESFQRAMECLNNGREPDPVAIATCYNSIGLILMDKGELSKARKRFKKALEFEEQSSSTTEHIFTDIHSNLDMLKERLRQAKDAEEHSSRQIDNGNDQFGSNGD